MRRTLQSKKINREKLVPGTNIGVHVCADFVFVKRTINLNVYGNWKNLYLH